MTETPAAELNREGLRTLADSDSMAKKAFTLLAGRQRKRQEITADVLMRDLDVSRPDVIGVFKDLERLGCGRMIVGRGNNPTRFRWYYTMGTVAQFALRQIAEVEPMPGAGLGWSETGTETDSPAENTAPVALSDNQSLPPATASIENPAPRIVNYPYPLRPGLLISVSLPADMTAQEADRLAAFIRALAVAPGPGGQSAAS